MLSRGIPAILIFSAIICLRPAFADVRSFVADLNNDGKEETIRVEDRLDSQAPATITVLTEDGDCLGSFSLPGRVLRAASFSLNKDKKEQIFAWSRDGYGYLTLTIYGLRGGSLYQLFKESSACGIDTDFDAQPPVIKVCVKEDAVHGAAGEGEEFWLWDGEKFLLHE